MHIVAGRFKGRKLKFPLSNKVRPARQMVREALFSILGDLTELTIWDLFAGCGSVGLEALSRNAARCLFVDNFVPSLDCLRSNINSLGCTHESLIITQSLPKALHRIPETWKPADIVFLDPPYDQNLVASVLNELRIGQHILPSSWLVIEHSSRESIAHPHFNLADQRKYGQTILSFLSPQSSEGSS
jgi:16S rRNA (guanine966-N2)-methyltransferase